MLPTLFAQKESANQELFALLATLDAEQHAELLHAATRTLNHIHVVDTIFQAHLSGVPHSHSATNTSDTPALDALAFAVAESDAWYRRCAEALNERALADCIDFRFTDGDAGRMSRHEMLMHVITHGAYHRGQVGQLLKSAGLAPPRDLLTRFLHQTEPQRRFPVAETPATTALLVIDVQQGLCEGEGAAWDCEGLFARINALSQGARAAGCPVIWVQHQDAQLVPDSPAWQLPAALHTAAADLRVRKTTPDAFLRTPLQQLLQQHGVQHLVVCGMHTEFCVDTTVRRAMALGYPVTLAGDAHTSAGHADATPQQVVAHHNATLSNISSFGPRVSVVQTAQVRWS
jgi:nicotinamidase-related amidase/uncharacterized damage-inducible protein DinB